MCKSTTNSRRRTACWIVTLAFAGLAAPLPAAAQDGEKPGVVEEDLGDGFRAVSVNGGPPAIIDDNTGMILKQAYGRPIVYDQETGAVLYLDDNGEPAVRYKGAPKGDADSPENVKRVKRMKAFMKRAQAYSKGRNGRGPGKGEGKGKAEQAKKKPALTWDAVVAAHMQLLGADDESAQIIEPRLRAVLLQQDEIRRSTFPVSLGAKARKTLPGSNTLPAAIRGYLRAFTASQKGGQDAELDKGLAAYRAARKTQDTELTNLCEKLREVLTVSQEAKLVAVGVLS